MSYDPVKDTALCKECTHFSRSITSIRSLAPVAPRVVTVYVVAGGKRVRRWEPPPEPGPLPSRLAAELDGILDSFADHLREAHRGAPMPEPKTPRRRTPTGIDAAVDTMYPRQCPVCGSPNVTPVGRPEQHFGHRCVDCKTEWRPDGVFVP